VRRHADPGIQGVGQGLHARQLGGQGLRGQPLGPCSLCALTARLSTPSSGTEKASLPRACTASQCTCRSARTARTARAISVTGRMVPSSFCTSMLGAGGHGAVLERADHQVLAAAGTGARSAQDAQRVGLGAAAGEEDLAGPGVIAQRPEQCRLGVLDEGLPKSSSSTSRMASATGRETRVVAALSRYVTARDASTNALPLTRLPGTIRDVSRGRVSDP
jgi:hypothetical protein